MKKSEAQKQREGSPWSTVILVIIFAIIVFFALLSEGIIKL